MSGILLIMGILGYITTTISTTVTYQLALRDLNNRSMNQVEAQILINETKDKKIIAKSVWLAAGLTESAYKVIWQAGTEQPGSSPLNEETRAGIYITKACGLKVFSSEHKYKSGTGWPSFYQANKQNLVFKEDTSWLGIKRIEVLSKCGEHLGHIFEDGSGPTGLRYCINGAALFFVSNGV